MKALLRLQPLLIGDALLDDVAHFAAVVKDDGRATPERKFRRIRQVGIERLFALLQKLNDEIDDQFSVGTDAMNGVERVWLNREVRVQAERRAVAPRKFIQQFSIMLVLSFPI